jgi:2-polyprenyl-3-methyl-5-hydroxy-6-metoxy-1,4-benzoquinol methylase
MNVHHTDRPLKVLVVVASHGERHLEYLLRIIRNYQSMDLDVDIVVTAEAHKSIDLGVRVIVGTPTGNPRSLPFAHKNVFADNVGRYDLYVYTEDDIYLREESLRAFVRIDPLLASDEIAGFIRYEMAEDGTRFVPDVHATFHWRPDSARRRGEFLVAELTNEHSGFYVLTDTQLRKALASGSFVRSPYEGRYEMLESAATDVYVNCGFRKVICISHLESFLIHHLPNRYVGEMGIPLSLFQEQIRTLTEIEMGLRPAATLCAVEPKVLRTRCGKRFDETPSPELLRAIPRKAKTLLSVGCGYGATEYEVQTRGARVTAFPLDSVVGATAARQGIEVIHGSLDECLRTVKARRFHCVLMTNLVHLLPEPRAVLEQCAQLVGPAGSLVIEGRNFDHLPALIKRLAGVGDYRKMRSFAESGIHMYGPRAVKKTLGRVGFTVRSLTWSDRGWPWPLGKLAGASGRFGARTWIIQAQRRDLPHAVEATQTSHAVQMQLPSK